MNNVAAYTQSREPQTLILLANLYEARFDLFFFLFCGFFCGQSKDYDKPTAADDGDPTWNEYLREI